MKNFLITAIMILTLGMFANAQFDMQRSPNNGTEPNPIRPEITNEFSYLGAAYTIGSDPGNLTGEYGDYFVFRMFPQPNDIGISMTFYNADGKLKSIENPWLLNHGYSSTLGVSIRLEVVIAADKVLYNRSGTAIGPFWRDVGVFDKLGGYVDYVAISAAGSAVGGQVNITNFQFGNGWIIPYSDYCLYGFTNMATIRGDGINSNGNFTFNSGNNSVTFTSKAVAWNAETGVAMSGSFATGGPLGTQGWTHLTFTFGSFERHPVPEPATLLMLGLAAVGLPAVRRLRKG